LKVNILDDDTYDLNLTILIKYWQVRFHPDLVSSNCIFNYSLYYSQWHRGSWVSFSFHLNVVKGFH
jgi:hypothetical protein